jgi:CRISPR/Cas system-associated exonuclease Cas4 (RecB family)
MLLEALQSHMPQLREQVQVKLRHLHFENSFLPTRRKQDEAPSQTLHGSHSEVELRAHALRWVGVADYVAVFENDCEIVDFKNGDPDEEHKLQILIYALLWIRDQKLNPNRRIANKLTLSYESGTVDVPAPSENELNELERKIQTRTDFVRNGFSTLPPEARPSPNNCRFCDVRHLCSEYWKPQTEQQMAELASSSSDYADLEAKIISQQGMKCWKAVVVCSQALRPGAPILLRTSIFDNSLDEALLSGTGNDRVRILDGRLANRSSDASPTLVTISERSEGFLVKSI